MSEFEARSDLTRCILHVDLDCYYCQVEQKRLDILPSQPLAVLQWNKLLSVNYAARAFGVKRMDTMVEARRKCPNLQLIHVATYCRDKKQLEYHDGGRFFPSMMTHKISLDLYRRESLKILTVLEEMSDICQKASIDEAYLDVTQKVNHTIENHSTAMIDHVMDVSNILGALNPVEKRTSLSSLHDLKLILAGYVAYNLRERLKKELNYTCSVGIAHNKTLAKLASMMYKPDQQTIILASGVTNFIKEIPLGKIRLLGGKLGSLIIDDYQAEKASDLWPYDEKELCGKYGIETGTWLWGICRGIDHAKVVARSSKVRSILACKVFYPVHTMNDIEGILETLATELSSRLHEDSERNKRVPKTLSLRCCCNFMMYRRHGAFPANKTYQPTTIFNAAFKLLVTIPCLFPCSRLELGVNSFIDLNEAILKTNLITQFFPRIHTLPQNEDSLSERSSHHCSLSKQKREDISRYFSKFES
jgi:DNA polymerase eta